jgi:D-lactate dehydrogenase
MPPPATELPVSTFRWRETTALAVDEDAVCIFVNDKADAEALGALSRGRTRLVALRCTGFNHVDLQAAARFGLKVVRVTHIYSPYSVAEHAVALLLATNRKVHRAWLGPAGSGVRSRASCWASAVR